MKATTIQPKSSGGWQLALFGATSLLGQALRDCLDRRGFPVDTLQLFDRPDKEGSITEFRNEAVLVTRPDPDLLQRVDLAFLCGAAEESRYLLDWPEKNGFVAIDLSSASNLDPGVPVVHVGLNRGPIDPARNLVATPGPVAQALLTVLAPIDAAFGLKSVVATVFPPVSDRGEKGLNELYRQTVDLLNFQDIPSEVSPRQLAFNLVPRALAGTGEAGLPEVVIAAEIRRVLEARFAVEIGVVYAPVFHCHSILMQIGCTRPVSVDRIAGCLAGKEGMRVLESAAEKSTPVELAGEEAIHVRPLPGAADARSAWIWIVSDHLRTGVALNAVRLAERLVGNVKGTA